MVAAAAEVGRDFIILEHVQTANKQLDFHQNYLYTLGCLNNPIRFEKNDTS